MVTRRASAGQRSWQRFTVTVTQSAKAAQSAAKELCVAHWHASTAKSVAPTRGATGHFTSGYSTSPFQLHCYCLWFWFGLEPCTAAIKNTSTTALKSWLERDAIVASMAKFHRVYHNTNRCNICTRQHILSSWLSDHLCTPQRVSPKHHFGAMTCANSGFH